MTKEAIADLLVPYLPEESITTQLTQGLQLYLDLLLRWNARTNLTAVRAPEQIVQRQMGESLFAARLMPGQGTVLDFGSGAGFPGIPLQLLRPDLHFTLAESQHKKVSFLREVTRALELKTEIWPHRVEALPPERCFDVITMRAVDNSISLLPVAVSRIAAEGTLLRFTAAHDSNSIEGLRRCDCRDVPRSCGKVTRYTRV